MGAGMCGCGGDALWDGVAGFGGSGSGVAAGSVVEVGGHRLRIGKQVGEGAFSIVFRASLLQSPTSRSEGSDGDVAIKLMLCQTPDLLRRGRHEIEILNECDHENIVRLLDSTVITSEREEDNEIWFLFPLYQRGTLRSVLEGMAQHNEHWPERHVLELFLGLCNAVSVLHSRDPPLVHRDIKSLNVLLSDEGDRLVLMDFGSVSEARRNIGSIKDAIALEREADSGCSPLFRPPELYHPDNQTEIDERTDVWSLGCTLFEMAFWKSPFEEAYTHHQANIKLAVLSSKFDFPNDSPYSPDLHKLIRHMMHKDHQSRPFIDEVINTVQQLIERS